MSSIPSSHTCPQYEKPLSFGKHQLPLETATSFSVYPGIKGSFSENPRQVYEINIRFKTPGRKTNSEGDFKLIVDTLEKTEALIRTLCQNNLHWNMWVKAVEISPSDRTIDLKFDPNASAGAFLQAKCRWGDIFLLFQDSLGLTSPAYKAGLADPGTIRLTFEEGVEDLHLEMEATLRKLDGLSQNHQIRKFLKENPEFPLKLESKEEEEKGPVVRKQKNPLRAEEQSSGLDDVVFEVTEEAITSKKRVGGALDKWTEDDIPWLIDTTLEKPLED